MLALTLATLLSAADVPTVSVLYFENQTGDASLDPLRKGLAEMLMTDLVAWQGVRVVERTRLDEVLKELNFQQTKYVDKDTAAKLGKVMGAGYLVVGSITSGEPQLTVEARLVKADTFENVAALRERDKPDNVFDVEQRLANGLVAKLDAKLAPNDVARRRVRVPDLATLVAFGKSLELADQGKLEEAQAAMRAVVSRAPMFVLARERQQELLKKFQEYQKRKADLIAGSVLDAAARLESELKDEAKFDDFTLEQKSRFLTMRMLRGRFLARELKQHLSSRYESFRVVKVGSEGQALLSMRRWVENQRRYMNEYARAVKQHTTVANGVSSPPFFKYEPSPTETQLFTDARLGDLGIVDHEIETLARFVLEGRLSDGTSFTVAPLLANIDPKEGDAVRRELDETIRRAVEKGLANAREQNTAIQLLKFKAGLFADNAQTEPAVVTYQQLLDAFPTDGQTSWVEARIKELLEGKYYPQRTAEDWAEAQKTCDDMKIRLSLRWADKRLRAEGLKGLDTFAADLEKACLPATKRTEPAFAQVYLQLSHDAAKHDDCTRYVAFTQKYLEHNGSMSELNLWAKQYAWCSLGSVMKNVTFIHSRLEDGWSFDMPHNDVSILSYDGKWLTLSGRTDGPRIVGGEEESFDLRLERQPDGAFKCKEARWRRYTGKYAEGTCTVVFKTLLPKDGVGFDEGTFEASLVESKGGPMGGPRTISLSRGEFRVRRQ